MDTPAIRLTRISRHIRPCPVAMSAPVPASAAPTIEVHHLKESRSRRITWMLEELGKEFNATVNGYRVVTYDRLPSRLAPPELKQLHPLGKAPVLVDGAVVIIESGAILEYRIEKHGDGKFVPAQGSPDYYLYKQYMHYAEGSAMLPLLLKMYVSLLGAAGAPLHPRISDEIENHFGYLNGQLEGRDFFVGDSLTGADVQLTFACQGAIKTLGRDKFPNLTRCARTHAPTYARLRASSFALSVLCCRFVDSMERRPAYIRAKELHGE